MLSNWCETTFEHFWICNYVCGANDLRISYWITKREDILCMHVFLTSTQSSIIMLIMLKSKKHTNLQFSFLLKFLMDYMKYVMKWSGTITEISALHRKLLQWNTNIIKKIKLKLLNNRNKMEKSKQPNTWQYFIPILVKN